MNKVKSVLDSRKKVSRLFDTKVGYKLQDDFMIGLNEKFMRLQYSVVEYNLLELLLRRRFKADVLIFFAASTQTHYLIKKVFLSQSQSTRILVILSLVLNIFARSKYKFPTPSLIFH